MADGPGVTNVGANVHVRPVPGEIVDVRPTESTNPFSPITVMVEVAGEVFALTVMLAGLVLTVKSRIVNLTTVDLDNDPLVAVTATV